MTDILPIFDEIQSMTGLQVINVKVNHIYERGTDPELDVCLSIVHEFIEWRNIEIVASSAGVHTRGKNGIPHAHYVFIAKFPQKIDNKHSRHWDKFRRLKYPLTSLSTISFRYDLMRADKPCWQILSYPLKERNYLGNLWYTIKGNLMENDIKIFLENLGSRLFEEQIAIQERNEACEERKKEKLLNMYEETLSYLAENPDAFSNNVLLFLNWAETKFVKHQPIDQSPMYDSFSKNAIHVAQKIGLVSYTTMMKSKYNL